MASLGLPGQAGEHLAARAVLLDGTYREVAGRLPDNAQIVFDDDGRYDKRAYVFHGTVAIAAIRLWF